MTTKRISRYAVATLLFGAEIVGASQAVQAAPSALHEQCASFDLHPAQALVTCTNLIESHADQGYNLAVSYVNRAIAWLRQNNADKAIADSTSAIAVWPGYTRAFYVRGNAYLKKENLEHARFNFDRAIALDPSSAPAYSGRAFAYMKTKEFDRAIAEANTAIRINPNFATAYIARGTALHHIRDDARALDDLRQAIELNPRSPLAYNNRGVILREMRDPNRAIADFSKAVENDPEFFLAYRNRGVAWRQLHQYAQSISDLSRSLSLNGRDSNTFKERGITYYEMGDLGRSLQDFNQAIALDQKNAAALTNRGLLWEKKGDLRTALADYNAALVIEPARSDAAAGRVRIVAAQAAFASSKPEPKTPSSNFGQPEAKEVQSKSTTKPSETAGSFSRITGGIDARLPGQVSAAPVMRSLKDVVAACDRSARQQSDLTVEQSGGRGKQALPACYHGRAHLDCVLNAITEEAASIGRDYSGIVISNYANLNDVAAICKIEPKQIEDHMAKAGLFDARASGLQKAYNSSAACVGGVQKSISETDLSSMKDSQKLLRSMLESTGTSLEQAAVRQREVVQLMQTIRDAQKAMAAVKGIRASVCH
jgi:tetratricopeptide (TPR) repeat protein